MAAVAAVTHRVTEEVPDMTGHPGCLEPIEFIGHGVPDVGKGMRSEVAVPFRIELPEGADRTQHAGSDQVVIHEDCVRFSREFSCQAFDRCELIPYNPIDGRDILGMGVSKDQSSFIFGGKPRMLWLDIIGGALASRSSPAIHDVAPFRI